MQTIEHEKYALILTGSGYGLEVAPEAEQQKAELLKHSALVIAVDDNTSADAARSQVKKLAAMRNAVEKSRKAIKEPVLAIGKQIDAKAAEFQEEINREEKRITGLVGEYAAKVEEARRQAIREMEEKRKAEAAEQARLAKAEAEAAEAKRKADAAFFDGGDEEKAKADAEKATAEAERLRLEESKRAAEAAPIALVPEKADGVKFEPDFVVDDIHELYRYSSLLVTIEPKRREVLAEIKRLIRPDGTLPRIPGLSITMKPVVSTR